VRLANTFLFTAVATAGIFAASAASAQDVPMKVKGGHELGETSDQFFTEGHEKEIFGLCAANDFKGLKKATKHLAKVYCDELSDTRKKAADGKRTEYKIPGEDDDDALRRQTFTFDHARLVKVELDFMEPTAETNYKGKSYKDVFAGVKEAYGPPTSEKTETIQNAYSLQYELHKDWWVAPHAAVLVEEKPAPEAAVVVTAYTREEYDRETHKSTNPLE
jgi:hypothetical protein